MISGLFNSAIGLPTKILAIGLVASVLFGSPGIANADPAEPGGGSSEILPTPEGAAPAQPPAPTPNAPSLSPEPGAEPTTPVSPASVAEPPVTAPALVAPEAPASAVPAPSTFPPADAPATPVAPLTPPDAAPQASPLPHDLSPWGMFLAADIVVKAVMIGLAFASVLTWTVWIAKSLELSFARRSLKRAIGKLAEASGVTDAAQRMESEARAARLLVEQADLELRLSADVLDKEGLRDRVASRLQGIVASAGRAMNRGTGILATIGSTAPFIGLFGTVWGIMNSFIGISKAQTTNLAVVAPGIAEALLATAVGLIAAIPAVIIYNNFSRSIGAYKALLGEAAAEIMRHVSRDLDRGRRFQPVKAAAE